mgnify:CR=1 FL=1
MKSGKSSAQKQTRKSANKGTGTHLKGRKPGDHKPAVAASMRAGLLLSIPKVHRLMKRDRLNRKVGKQPAIIMAAVMEYVASEIIETAGEQARA